MAGIADLLRRHLPADDPLAAYADDLDVPELAERRLRGFLTGSIDAVLRARREGPPRYLVVDYKTNWLGEPATAPRLCAWHYRPDAMAAAMRDAHYPLQALLYSVALHRYLRWRQPGYDPATHLGGVLYLFLRGMCGPETPVVDGMPCGVFSWRRRPRWSSNCPTCSTEVLVTGREVEAERRPAAHAARRACSAKFNRAGVLGAADVHVATRLGRLGGETDERVLLAVALTVRAVRPGRCASTSPSARRQPPSRTSAAEALAALPWPDRRRVGSALSASPLVAVGVDGDPSRPLRLVGETLYLDRYWRQEQCIARVLDEARCASRPAVDRASCSRRRSRRLFRAGSEADRQRRAAAVAAHRWVSVLAGGPGTGKTTTVARLLARCSRTRLGGTLRVALAAPTGKAAERLRWRRGMPPSRSTRPTRGGSATWRRRRCTGSSAGDPGRGPASVTTARTGCPSTWSSSTRRRWSR